MRWRRRRTPNPGGMVPIWPPTGEAIVWPPPGPGITFDEAMNMPFVLADGTVLEAGDGEGMSMDLVSGEHRRWTIRDGVRTDERRVRRPETDNSWALDRLRCIYGCGCYDTSAVWELVRDVLRLMPLHQGTREECERLCGTTAAFMVVLDRMTDADLVVHGGSIGGSWAEPDGERLLTILEAAGDDLEEWAKRAEDEAWEWVPMATGEGHLWW